METASHPSVLEIILSLAVTDLMVVGTGMLIFWNWTREKHMPPVWVVVVVALAASLFYFGVTRYLWIQSSEAVISSSFVDKQQSSLGALEASNRSINDDFNEARPVVILLMFSVGFWTIPVAYYSYVFLSSFATQNVDRLTWLGVATPYAEEFPEARELAVMGDVEGAVGRYRSYYRRKNHAVFAAAQLLEADGQYERAAETFRDVVDLSAEDTLMWSKAMYRLAKLSEKHSDDTQGTLALLQEITARVPDSEHGQLASSLMKRLRPSGETVLDDLDAAYGGKDLGLEVDERRVVNLRNPVGPDGVDETPAGAPKGDADEGLEGGDSEESSSS